MCLIHSRSAPRVILVTTFERERNLSLDRDSTSTKFQLTFFGTNVLNFETTSQKCAESISKQTHTQSANRSPCTVQHIHVRSSFSTTNALKKEACHRVHKDACILLLHQLYLLPRNNPFLYSQLYKSHHRAPHISRPPDANCVYLRVAIW